MTDVIAQMNERHAKAEDTSGIRCHGCDGKLSITKGFYSKIGWFKKRKVKFCRPECLARWLDGRFLRRAW